MASPAPSSPPPPLPPPPLVDAGFSFGAQHPQPWLMWQELSRIAGLSRAFTTAVKLRLPTLLHDHGGGGGTALQIAQLLQVPLSRVLVDWLDLLTSLGVLVADDDDGQVQEQHDESSPPLPQLPPTAATRRYRNSPAAEAHLLEPNRGSSSGSGSGSGSGSSVAAHAVVYHTRSFPHMVFLEHALRTGGGAPLPPLAAQLVAPILDTFRGAGDAGKGGDAGAFAAAMSAVNRGAFEAFARSAQFDWRSSCRSLGDFGGSVGTLCCVACRAHPHLRAVTYDLPALRAAAEAAVAAEDGGGLGLGGRVRVADVDLFDGRPLRAALPGARQPDADGDGGEEEGPSPSSPSSSAEVAPHDVITMSMVLHDQTLARKRLLVRKAFEALPLGGRFVVLETLIDDARRANAWALNMSLDMALEFAAAGDSGDNGGGGAFDYSAAEFDAWARAAGFARTQLIRLVGPYSACVAFKE